MNIKSEVGKKSQNPPLTITHPELVKEWFIEKNIGLSPEKFIYGSKTKVWWKCPKGADHVWEAVISNRSKGVGCPICRGLKVVKSNCLATTNPAIASEWDIKKNFPLTPNQVTKGSHKKVWWQCPVNPEHQWLVSISHRTNGTGCPYCSNQKVDSTNSLSALRPDLVNEWNVEKNGQLTPQMVNGSSSKKVWWKCQKVGHEWQTTIKNRSVRRFGCPLCSNQRVSETNNVLVMRPDLAKEWHPTKNGKLMPIDVVYGSNWHIWWQCSKAIDHVWEASVSERKSGNNCPYCSNQKVVASNSFQVKYPDLAKEWHPTKNGDTTPSDVVAGGNIKYWWICPKGTDHEWMASIYARIKGTGCPVCEGLKVVNSNSLATTNPKLAKEWHPTKNNTLTPNDVIATSSKKVWWQCSIAKEHIWQAYIENRSRKGYGCPFCSGRHADSKRNLTITNPELVTEWHPTKNEDLKPENFLAKSNTKIWWVCKKDNTHIWKSAIYSRTSGGGCPYCNSGWTLEKIRLFVKSILENINSLTPAELYVIFQQNGLLVTTGQGHSFIKALVTGAFPKEELEKFANGKNSLVDDFIGNHQQTLEETLAIDDINVDEAIPVDNEVADKGMPLIETKDVLSALNSQVISSADEEAVEFLLTSACSKIWKHAFVNEIKALEQAEKYSGSSYADSVQERFLEQYNGAKELVIPNGYSFKIDGKITQPNLMQRLVAYQVQDKKKVGNWSGTGAGKTLSAILASRVIDAKLTIICCPNSVVAGWTNNIKKIYPDSVVHVKTLQPKITDLESKNHYLVLNYELFQQENSEALVKSLIDQYKVDFVVIDEIHHSKQRVVEDMSKRKRIITGMITSINQNNSNLHVLGMSATPVINNLYEGKALLEMITGVHYDDLKTIPTVNNCMSLYQKLTTNGTRWMPAYEQELNLELVDIDCSEYVEEIKELGLKSSYVDLEGILTKAKLPEIRKRIKEKTIIYTHYLKNILETLKTEIEKDGWKVAYFTGDDKTGLNSFMEGNADVLIASSSIGTGVDGLQYICNRLIVNILPWTHAEFEQLKGRIYRQGQTRQEVDIIVPLTHAEVNGEDWSWCKSKWDRIQFKKSIADAAVDGIVPEGHLRSPAQAYEDVMSWLKRLEEGKIHQIERQPIHIPLSDTVIQTRVRKFGDFSEMNRRIHTSTSETTNKRFQNNPEEWELYHALYREARKEWTVVPYEEIINWCKKRPELVIGDFGCGEAKVAEALENTVHSFDHVAINDKVIAGDMANVPLEDASLDVAVFSLSLMGTNFTDYIKEAHRCLKLDGILYIVEPISKFNDLDEFIKGLERLGFDIFKPEEKYKFTFIRGVKSERKMGNAELSF